MTKKRPVKKRKVKSVCESCHKKKVCNTVDHLSLTGEYLNREHKICEPCLDSIRFQREVSRQQRELASEEEQISGDYED